MFENIYYAVRLENGNYYTAQGFRVTDNKESENIEDANMYTMYWQIPKDLYLQQYLYGKDIGYEVIKVKVSKSYEIIGSFH